MKAVLLKWMLPLIVIINVNGYTQTGVLDTTFGIGGKVMTPDSSTTGQNAIAVQPDGKIVMGGTMPVAGKRAFMLMRYLPDGTPDSSFGVAGKVISLIRYESWVSDVAVQPDGKIIAAGYSDSTGTSVGGGFTVARFNANGSLDTAFGNGGVAVTIFQTGFAYVRKVLIEPGGEILAAGTMSAFTFEDYGALAKYLPNGEADTTFGTGGSMLFRPQVLNGNGAIRGVSDMALAADGKIVTVLEADPAPVTNGANFIVCRLLANGSYDTIFGNNGVVETDINGNWDISYGVAILPDSSIVLAGETNTFSSPGTMHFALAKYHSNGTLDNSFGNGGKVVTAIGASSSEAIRIVASPLGKLYVGGYSWNSAPEDFVLAAYNADGSPDTTFAPPGYVFTDFAASQDRLKHL